MANNCIFMMKVHGEEASVKEFVSMLKGRHLERNFVRIFSLDVTNYKTSRGIATAEVIGDCAWSVHSCMMKGDDTYPSMNPSFPDIETESKGLGVQVEVWSFEPGEGFSEHYLFSSGKKQIENVSEYCPDIGEPIEFDVDWVLR